MRAVDLAKYIHILIRIVLFKQSPNNTILKKNNWRALLKITHNSFSFPKILFDENGKMQQKQLYRE